MPATNRPWDGIKRRTADKFATDHDILIEMVTLMGTHVSNFDRHVASYADHVREDNRRFDIINRSVWLGTGCVSALVFVINLWKH